MICFVLATLMSVQGGTLFFSFFSKKLWCHTKLVVDMVLDGVSPAQIREEHFQGRDTQVPALPTPHAEGGDYPQVHSCHYQTRCAF